MIPVKYRVYEKVMCTLRMAEVGKWFKLHNAEHPAARYSVITLISYTHSTLYKASLNPRNQQAFLNDRPDMYDRAVIRGIYRTLESWYNKLLSCCRGGELFSDSIIARSKYQT